MRISVRMITGASPFIGSDGGEECPVDAAGVKIVTGQDISPTQLPDFARDQVREELRFVSGIGKIEEMIATAEDGTVAFSLPGGSDLAAYMTSQAEYAAIHRIYKTTHVSELASHQR